ncbi:MAG: S8 family serine peptidase [Bacteroidota bacterium]
MRISSVKRFSFFKCDERLPETIDEVTLIAGTNIGYHVSTDSVANEWVKVKGFKVIAAEKSQVYLNLINAISNSLSFGADIINLSLKVRTQSGEEPIFKIIEEARVNKSLVVVAAGNDGPIKNSLSELAKLDWTISVGATDKKRRLVDLSSRGGLHGGKPTLVTNGAPGGASKKEVKEMLARYGYTTSFATGKVSRVIAGLKMFIYAVINVINDADVVSTNLKKNRLKLPIITLPDSGSFRQEIFAGNFYRGIHERKDRYFDFFSKPEHIRWMNLAMDEIAKGVEEMRVELDVNTIIRRLLKLACVKLDDYSSYEVGFGYISSGIASRFLSNFNFKLFLSCFYPKRYSEISNVRIRRTNKKIGPLFSKEYASELFIMGHNTIMYPIKIWR